MTALTSEALRQLCAPHAAPCVSLYLSARTGPDGSARARLDFEHQLAQAEKQCAESLGLPAARALVAPLRALTPALFEAGHAWGVAALASAGFSVHFRLLELAEDLLVVAPSFHVRPLLRALQSNRRFFLLSLSQHYARLFRGSAEGLAPIDVPALPRSLEAALELDKRESFLHYHPSAAGRSGRAPIFHGHGAGGGPTDEDLLHYFRAIDRALWPLLAEERAALVLAAPTEHHALYRLANRDPYLLGRGVEGNYERTPLAELHARAWPLVQELARAREAELADEFGTQASRGRATAELTTIARHAVEGRVRTLLLADDVKLWGQLDPATGAVELSGQSSHAGRDDVLDDIAEAVILRGGEVLGLARERMPARAEIAALLRW